MTFQPSLMDGAVHWHRAPSRKLKRTWSLLSDKFISYYCSHLLSDKFISYYCSQFSQSASTWYYRAKRSEKEHIRDYLN
ncbi:Eukaryotic/viral aspartic protease [Phytophthora megakarya]|uniref:Eukaryotic/viral aspartic protease n=1 Tax=Phytophthora megakarya TaxID=4795 RepID=A0A225VHI2_9STRA|nr:Eukaryotic/viral aspartic protease [Phytophthora megakarya]